MRLITIILFMLLPMSLSAQSYNSMRLDSLREYAFNKLSIPSSGTQKITTAKANRVINEAIAKVCDDFDAIGRVDTLSVGVDSDGVALPSNFLRARKIFKLIDDTTKIPLGYFTDDEIENIYNSEEKNTYTETDNMQPRHFYTHNGRFFLHPRNLKPSTDLDEFIVEYWAVDTVLNADASVTGIDKEYRDELLDLICGELSIMRDDYTKGEWYLARYDKKAKPEPLKDSK